MFDGRINIQHHSKKFIQPKNDARNLLTTTFLCSHTLSASEQRYDRIIGQLVKRGVFTHLAAFLAGYLESVPSV